MKSRTLVGALLLFGVLAAATVAAIEPNVAVRRQGIAFFLRPTQVAGQLVIGKALIVHDDAKMARGEPCTTIYRFGKSGTEEIVSFMCKPAARPLTDRLTVRCVPNRFSQVTDVMTEFQFAGEIEAHGVTTSR